MAKSIVITSDGSIENTKLILDGVEQSIYRFTFSADVDDFSPRLVIEPCLVDDPGLTKELEEINRIEEHIAAGTFREYTEAKKKELEDRIYNRGER